jgi:GTP-binding protein
VALNKWDLARKAFEGDKVIEGFQTIKDFEDACRKSLLDRLFFVNQAPFVFLSAKESRNLDPLIKAGQKVEASQDQRWSTPQINRLIAEVLRRNLPRNPTGKMFKVYYATQTGTRPYRVRLFCNQAEESMTASSASSRASLRSILASRVVLFSSTLSASLNGYGPTNQAVRYRPSKSDG